MSSPYRHGPSGVSDPNPNSTSRPASSNHHRFTSPFSPIFSGSNYFYTHPARTSLLNPSGELIVERDSSLEPRTGSGLDLSAARDSQPPAWMAGGALPSFSRAFDVFTMDDIADKSVDGQDGRFFVPSYLQTSTYVQELQVAHRMKTLAQDDSDRSDDRGPPKNLLPGYPPSTLPPGSHRGMSHTIIERPPRFSVEDDETLTPLPTRWNRDDCWGSLDIGTNGTSIKYNDTRNHNERDHEAYAVRADHHIPPQCGIYYFEVHVLASKRDETLISVGLSTHKVALSRAVGWEPESWGYHADDGRSYNASNVGKLFGPNYGLGDVVGCGINFRDRSIFFTKNGIKLGVAFQDVTKQKLYPSISLKKPGEHVMVNFGQTAFVYNIDDMMRAEQEKILQEIDAADTSQLEPGMGETDLIQALVLQFLQHDGYVETARAFAEDLRVQRQALSLDPEAKVAGINIKDDEDANNRQRIRRAVLEGDIDKALKLTNAYYPSVLRENEDVYFRLRCRRFIEMVRKAAQLSMAGDVKRSNGHVSDAGAQDMDIDGNSGENNMLGETMETEALPSVELIEAEREMLEYGQALQAEYANEPRDGYSKSLGEIWGLVAYKNPLKEPRVAHLLEKEGRVPVSEELNSAILLSLGKSSTAALEEVYAQTCVLLEDLRNDGGDGAFVSVRDTIDGIPVTTDL